MDPITSALQLGFFVLFGVSVWQFMQHRGPLELSVVAIFGSIVALFVLSLLNALQPALTPIARPVLIALLLAQPFLVIRLISQIHPVRQVLMRVAFARAPSSRGRRSCSWPALPPAIGRRRPRGHVLLRASRSGRRRSSRSTAGAAYGVARLRLAVGGRRDGPVRRFDPARRPGQHRPARRGAELERLDDGHPAPRAHRDARLPGRVRAAGLVPPRDQPVRRRSTSCGPSCRRRPR